MIEQTVQELTPIVGTRPACRALGASPGDDLPSSPSAASPGRAGPGRARQGALRAASATAVLDVLHSARFVDCSPAQVWATLLDEGRYLASERTMYRLLAAHTARCASGAISSRTPPTPARAAGRAPERAVELGHLEAQGPGEVDVLLPLRDPGRLQPLRRRLDRAAPRERAQLAKALIAQACEQQHIPPGQLTVHADRGTSMSSKPVAFLLADLGVTKTTSGRTPRPTTPTPRRTSRR